MKTVLLTGVTGFLGSNLLKGLLQHNYPVVILKRSTSDTWRIEEQLLKVKSYNVDCGQMNTAFTENDIDTVIHTACHYGRSSDSFVNIIDTNLMFGIEVMGEAIQTGVNCFINTDTFLDKYLNDYSLSKKQFLEWLKQKKKLMKVVNLKLEHMYGPNDDVNKFVAWFLRQLEEKKGGEIALTEGTQLRDFIYIDDVVSSFLTVLEQKDTLDNFNEFEVGTGISMSVRDFILKLRENYELVYGNVNVDLKFGEIPYRENEKMAFRVDNAALRKLGWSPLVSIDEGILRTVKERA